MDPVFGRLEREVSDLMDHLLRRRFTPASYQRVWAPRVDVYEREGEYIAVVELAGVAQDAVSVEVEDKEVSIVGERQAPDGVAGCPGATPLQLEVPYGPFERRFVLPAPVDASRATASFDGGILTVRLPIREPEPKRVQVEVK